MIKLKPLDKKQFFDKSSEYSFVGEVIGNYIIEEVINVTNTWFDLKVIHNLRKRPYFLRLFDSKYTNNPTFRQRFQREAKISTKLNHKNIFPLTNAGSENEVFYIVKEYKDCMSLEFLVENYEKLSPIIVINIGIQLSNALQYIHKNKVIHRNINPHNIYIETEGYVLLSGFGYSATLDQPQTDTTLEDVNEHNQII